MKINLQGKGMEVSAAIEEYAVKKMTNLGKLLTKIEENGGEVLVNFSVGRTSNHHRGGDVFRADCSISIDGENFYSGADREDMNEAIDEVKENLFREIRRAKERKKALFQRGSRAIKNMLKGITGK